MSPITGTMPLARCALIALAGATALSLSACGTSNDNAPTSAKSSATSSAAASAKKGHDDKDRVTGLIASVTGNTIGVTEKNGNATVGYSDSTKISEITAAQLTDVTAGSCVMVRPTEGSTATATTAKGVMIGPAENGKCPEHKGPQGDHGVRGVVASVSGSTIVVNVSDASGTAAPTNVTVSADTKFMKRAQAQSSAIAVGKCIMARGDNDNSGGLQATDIVLRPAKNGACEGRGGEHDHQR